MYKYNFANVLKRIAKFEKKERGDMGTADKNIGVRFWNRYTCLPQPSPAWRHFLSG